MFNGLMKTNKFSSKCKSQLKLTKARVEMIKKKRNAMQRYLRNDIADLLRNGLDVNAYGRAEGLLAEMNLSSCYDYLEQFCVQVSNNLAAMNSQRECPEDCKEAVASLVFAAARVADLPELRELRTILTERYGNSLECFVNPMFVEKLKSTLPTKDMKLQLMQDIATEIGLTWNAYAMEQKLYNSPAFQRDLAKKSVDDEFRTHKKPDKSMPYKDVQREKTGRGGHVPEEEYDDRKSYLPHQSIPPPYDKSKVGKTRHQDERLEPAESDGFVGRRDKHHLDASVSESKPKPRSVRRNAKPASGGESRTDKKDVERRKKDHHNQPDEEERKMDKLLDHYSQKKSPNGTGKSESVLKPPPQQAKASAWRLPKWGSWDVSSTRETPRPVEPANPPPETKKGHARAASLGPTGHVHPKLPDYDDFIARLAALKGGN